MNYIAEINAFMDSVAISRLSSGQQALWFALMHIANRCGWQDWLSISNQTLIMYTGLSRAGIEKARNVLKQKGYIDFKTNGTKATTYRLMSKSRQDGIQDSMQNSIQNSIQDGMQDGMQDGSTYNKQTKQTKHKQNIEENLKRKAPQAEAENCPYEKIKESYHSICISYPQLRNIDGNRKKAIAARWRTYKSLDVFNELFQIAENSSFLKGNNDRNWCADFDWLMKPTNFAKVLEHKYDDSNGSTAKKTAFNDFENKHDYDIAEFERKALESRMGV